MERRLKRRVLVIEDDTDVRRLITEALKPFEIDELVGEAERAVLN